jgi:hypothetical protein
MIAVANTPRRNLPDLTAPDHLWLDNGHRTGCLHFDKPLKEAVKIMYTGWALPGRWCAEDRPKYFTHFHRTVKVAALDLERSAH